jgi:hypothetical protein
MFPFVGGQASGAFDSGGQRYKTKWHNNGATWVENRAEKAVTERDQAAAAIDWVYMGSVLGRAPAANAGPGPAPGGRHGSGYRRLL